MTIPDENNSVSAASDPADNPFAASQRVPGQSTPVARPTGATVIGVLCTIMGMLGVLSSLVALLNALFSAQVASMFSQGGGPLQDAQAEMNEQMAAVLAKYFIPNLLLSIGGIVLSAMLSSGGVGLLVGKAWSRKLLRRTLLLLIVFEILRAVVYAFTQFEVMPITQEYMEKIAAGANGGPGGEFVAQFSTAFMVIGIVIWGGWILIKLALMAWGRHYIGSAKLDDYFAA